MNFHQKRQRNLQNNEISILKIFQKLTKWHDQYLREINLFLKTILICSIIIGEYLLSNGKLSPLRWWTFHQKMFHGSFPFDIPGNPLPSVTSWDTFSGFKNRCDFLWKSPLNFFVGSPEDLYVHLPETCYLYPRNLAEHLWKHKGHRGDSRNKWTTRNALRGFYKTVAKSPKHVPATPETLSGTF